MKQGREIGNGREGFIILKKMIKESITETMI